MWGDELGNMGSPSSWLYLVMEGDPLERKALTYTTPSPLHPLLFETHDPYWVVFPFFHPLSLFLSVYLGFSASSFSLFSIPHSSILLTSILNTR